MYVYNPKAVSVRERLATEADTIRANAEKQIAQLEKAKAVIDALDLYPLFDIARQIAIEYDDIKVYLKDTREHHKAAMDYIDGVNWGRPRWYAETQDKWDGNRRRTIIRRRCEWYGKVGEVGVLFQFAGDGPELKEGDKLPSGCVIRTEITASVGATAVTCDMPR